MSEDKQEALRTNTTSSEVDRLSSISNSCLLVCSVSSDHHMQRQQVKYDVIPSFKQVICRRLSTAAGRRIIVAYSNCYISVLLMEGFLWFCRQQKKNKVDPPTSERPPAVPLRRERVNLCVHRGRRYSVCRCNLLLIAGRMLGWELFVR